MAGRKIILLVDNAKCHSSSNLNLHNITIHYLPPNTTSRIQPLDAGIIMSFKRRYRSYFIKWLLDQYESKKDDKLNVLDAIKFIVRAWREVSSETVTLSAVEVLEHYLMQQDVGDVARSNHDQALSNLQKEIKKLRNSSFKQVNIKAFFELAD
ncbi:12350_t:CDS:2 [Cetraspora pellucida]|uniref:12350_t:CDS:1 n=1 Tax=Cetraspora pellucida TaxID=1433469 RepID=A0A9N9DMU8_9GLOM|nr:12350_t:CDS:2 [Cetraspora pellucida]